MIARLGDKNQFLKGAILLILGHPPQSTNFPEHLAVGLSYVDTDHKEFSTDIKLFTQTKPEPLILQAALRFIDAENDACYANFLKSGQLDSSILGKHWEYIVAAGLMKNYSKMLDKLKEINDLPPAFVGDWKIIQSQYGRIGHPNSAGATKFFFEWQDWCISHMRYMNQHSNFESIPAVSSSSSSAHASASQPMQCSILSSMFEHNKKNENNEMENSKEEATNISNMMNHYQVRPYSLCLTSNALGPDICMVLHQDDFKKIMFVLVQVKLSYTYIYDDAILTVDPAKLCFRRRGESNENWIETDAENLIVWMTNILLDDIPIIRMVISGAESNLPAVPKLVPINREEEILKLFQYQIRDERKKENDSEWIKNVNWNEEVVNNVDLTMDQMKELCHRLGISKFSNLNKENLWNHLKMAYKNGDKPMEKKFEDAKKEIIAKNADRKSIEEEAKSRFQDRITTDPRYKLYKQKKDNKETLTHDVLINTNSSNTKEIIGEHLMQITKDLKDQIKGI